MRARPSALTRSIRPSTQAGGPPLLTCRALASQDRSSIGHRGYPRRPVIPRRPTRPQLVLLGLVVAGAAVRFATLDLQSFWIDEGYTVRMLRMDLGGLFHTLPK